VQLLRNKRVLVVGDVFVLTRVVVTEVVSPVQSKVEKYELVTLARLPCDESSDLRL
jgi:hypothetical protein